MAAFFIAESNILGCRKCDFYDCDDGKNEQGDKDDSGNNIDPNTSVLKVLFAIFITLNADSAGQSAANNSG